MVSSGPESQESHDENYSTPSLSNEAVSSPIPRRSSRPHAPRQLIRMTMRGQKHEITTK